jgi:beta-lactamase regulating signal transducer with metallopeptidase domain/type II secretory pathway component GspD/PulD (secretin)
MILQWLASPEWGHVVQTLLHTVWQGAAIAVLLGLGLRRMDNPATRYRCSLAAMAGVLLAGMVTWSVLNRPLSPSVSKAPASQIQPARALVANPDLPPLVMNFPMSEPRPGVSPWSAWLALIWLAGTTAMIFRAGFQVAGAEQLRRSARPLEDARLAGVLDGARRAVGVARRVRIAVTDRLTSPAVVGVLVPTLILPLSLTTTLTPEQIRFVLLHELAHIRRGDYFASLFQLFAEALLFFNPAVWWISRQMRIEREACCDTLAVELSGAPADYARTLVSLAENVLKPAPAAAMAFGNRREPSSLADRVQRMLVPGYRPTLRLTWRAMLMALLVGGGLLFLSALGTQATVAAILSPQERIDRIEKKMTELVEKPEPENFNGNSEDAPQVKISGQIHTADGTPVPEWVWLNLNSSVKHSSFGTVTSARNGFFTNTIRAGSILIGAEVTNFAPVAIGPLDGFATNRFENLEIILQRGFDVPLQLADKADGQPVANAKIATMYWMQNEGFQPHFWESGMAGSVMLTHCADLPLDVTVSVPGYEMTKKRFDHVRAGEPLRVELRRGVRMSGTVLDKTTGQPIAGAELHLLYQADVGQFQWDDSLHLLGKTDSRGAFMLDQFGRNSRYYIGVSAPGHESVILDSVSAENNSWEVRLGPELVVRGHVIGNLDGLQQIDKHRVLDLSTSRKFEENSYGNSEWVRLHVVNGVATFQFTNRVAGPVTLSGGGYREERDVTAPIADWVVNLDEARKTEAKFAPAREVIFRFKHPSGVPPRGTVEVTAQEMQITNGEVHVQIAIGGRTSIEPKRMVGYWFNRFGDWTSPSGEHGNLLAIAVTNGTGPLVIEIPLIPAGAIYARARNADGTPAGGLIFGVSELKRAPDVAQSSLLGSDSDGFSGNAPRKWVSGPLPLGGTYQIYGWRGNSFCVSQPIKLTEANPDAEVELQFPSGKTFAGVVLNTNGQPLRDAELKVSFLLPDNHSFELKSVFTDARGQFRLEDMTPALGHYSVQLNAPGVMAESVKLNFGSQPQTIRLKPGRKLAGRVVEAGTGYALTNTEVRAWVVESQLPQQTTRTDADGHFEFTTLGDGNYTFFCGEGQVLTDKKFRADGRTNVVISVKLYEWSKVKPKVPAATVGETNVTGILSNSNFDSALRELKQRNGAGALAEPEQVTTSGRGINKITMADISGGVSNWDAGRLAPEKSPEHSENAGTKPVTFRLMQPISSDVLLKKLREAGVEMPPTVFFYRDNGILFVRGTPQQLALVNRLVLNMNGISPKDIDGADKEFSNRVGLIESAGQTETNLIMRTFKVDTNSFVNGLREQTGFKTNSVPVMARSVFSKLGVDLESSKGKTVFYGDRLGLLFVRATESDLDTIEKAISNFNLTPMEIHIKARFVEVPKGTFQNVVAPNLFTNADFKSGTNIWPGLLADKKFKIVMKALEATPGFENLAEPEVTSISGRQTQMRATEIINVVTNFTFQEMSTNPAISPQVAQVEIGPVIDVVPFVLSDGCTIDLRTVPSLMEFLGYDETTNTTVVHDRTGAEVNLPQALPRFSIRQDHAHVNMYDGQTVVLSGLIRASVTSTKKQSLPPVKSEDLPPVKSVKATETLVFITATLVDSAGNRIHADDALPFARDAIPPQPVAE